MKYTGRIVMMIVSFLFSLFQLFIDKESISKEMLDFAAATIIAFFAGWQYDRQKSDWDQRKENAESYKQLLELLPEAVFIHSDDRILYVNKEGQNMLTALSYKQIKGRSIYDFLYSENQQQSAAHIERVYKEKTPVTNIEKKVVRLDGKVIDCDISSLFVSFEGKKAVLSIVKDLTVHKEQTATLLQKSEKLALVGQLAAGIAHEIRNPLTAIKGFVQLSRMQNENRDEYFDIMLTELDRINLIVSELLVLSKPMDVVYKKQQVAVILQDVVTLLQSQASMDNVVIALSMESDIPAVRCEENQLKQVFINVLKNAMEAMPDGGRIEVALKREENTVVLLFTDEGTGIAEERLPKLGEPFYTTKEKGTGLGLMTCMKIMESHGGEMSISSKAGEGTLVKVSLPVA